MVVGCRLEDDPQGSGARFRLTVSGRRGFMDD